MSKQKCLLGTFALTMITVAAILNLRNLPFSAEFGLSSIFYFLICALIFLIPIALVTAELAAGWPEPGGSYIWVGQAFGKKWGFYALSIAWMSIITWFPMVMAFIASILAHILAPLLPGLEGNKPFYFIVMLSVFWGATFLNFLGIKISSYVTIISVLCGTVIPSILIICLGIWWVADSNPLHITFTWKAILPDFQLDNIVLFSGILLSLAGVEVSAYHILNIQSPKSDFPRAIIIAAMLILLISILGALSIAIVVPQADINLISGVMQAFKVFFYSFNMPWAVSLVALLILIGSFATINTWIIGPAKGLLTTARDGFLPPLFLRVNAKGIPIWMLIFQAIIGTVLSLIFLWYDSQSIAYWILTALCAQLSMVEYGLVFAASLRLRYSHPDIDRPYQVPGGKLGIWLTSGLGILACLFGFLIVFLPPSQLEIGNQLNYSSLLCIIFFILSFIPLLFFRRNNFDVNELLENTHLPGEISLYGNTIKL